MQKTVTALLSVWAGIAAATSAATPALAGSVGDVLKERYQLSQIDVQNQAIEGRVSRTGSVLVLRADQVPANRLRTVQINTKSPRFHVRDYARVDVAPDGTLSDAPGDFSLPRGTRLVVLDGRARACSKACAKVSGAGVDASAAGWAAAGRTGTTARQTSSASNSGRKVPMRSSP